MISLSKIKKYHNNSIEGEVVVGTVFDEWLNENNDPGNLLTTETQFIKNDAGIRAAIVYLDKPRSALFVKEYSTYKLQHKISSLFGKYRAKSVWDISLYMASKKLPIACPLAIFIVTSGAKRGTSYLFSESLSDYNNLAEVGRHNKELFRNYVTAGLLNRLAQGIANLHSIGISHGDLKWSNILVSKDANQFRFVDLDASHHRKWFRERAFIGRDLTRFIVSAVEVDLSEDIIKRFIQSYSNARLLPYEFVVSVMRKRLRKLINRKFGHKKMLDNFLD